MSKSNGSAFVKDDGVEAVSPVTGAMNLRKWLDKGKARVIKRVEVCLAAANEAEIRDLDAQITAAQGKRLGVIDDRLASAGPDLHALAERVEELRTEMRESMTVFKFTGLKAGQVLACRDAASVGEDGEPDGEEVGLRILAAQCVEPTGLTWEDFRTLGEAIGDEPFVEKIYRTARAAMSGVVDIPFSLAASQILSTPRSSES